MKALKKSAIVVIGLVAVVSMSACSSSVQSDGTNSSVTSRAVSFPDGSKVDCLFLNSNQSAGLRCDWMNPSVETSTDDALLGSIQTLGGKKVRCVSYDGTKEGAMDCELNVKK